MNFQAVKELRYWWPVKVRIPDPSKDNAGTCIEQTFKMQFRAIEREDAVKAYEERALLDDPREVMNLEHAQLLERCTNWDGVTEGEGDDARPMPFSEEALQSALQHSWFRTAVYTALAESDAGLDHKTGN